MSVQIMVPSLGESVSEATVLKWFKNVGEAVEADEPLVELETDKVTVEVPAPASGVLTGISANDGAEVAVGGLLGSLEEGATASTAPPPPAAAEATPGTATSKSHSASPAQKALNFASRTSNLPLRAGVSAKPSSTSKASLLFKTASSDTSTLDQTSSMRVNTTCSSPRHLSK